MKEAEGRRSVVKKGRTSAADPTAEDGECSVSFPDTSLDRRDNSLDSAGKVVPLAEDAAAGRGEAGTALAEEVFGNGREEERRHLRR